MNLSFAVYYDRQLFPKLLRDCICPLLEDWTSEGWITQVYSRQAKFKGENFRFWLVLETELSREEVKQRIEKGIHPYLFANPAEEIVVQLPLNRLFLRFPNNSIQYFSTEDKSFEKAHQKLGDKTVMEIMQFGRACVSDLDRMAPIDLTFLSIQLYTISIFALSKSNLQQFSKMLRESFDRGLKEYHLPETKLQTYLQNFEGFFEYHETQLLDQVTNFLFQLLSERTLGDSRLDHWYQINVALKKEPLANRWLFDYFELISEVITHQLAYSNLLKLQSLYCLQQLSRTLLNASPFDQLLAEPTPLS